MNEAQPLPTNVAMVPCDFCGMPCTPNEYHPYAACLMFKACHNSDTVRANLEAVRGTPAPVGVEPAEYALVPVEPTPEMLSEIWVHKNGSLSEAYRAMLAAAPQPVVREPLTDEAARKQGANHD